MPSCGGVSVIGCGSGAEACAALEQAPVDFVTTALRLARHGRA